MNPSTADIVAAVQSVPAKTVFVLPNNKNIIMAAEQAQGIADRTIVVLSTRTIPQGITAMLNFDPDASEYENATNMMQAADKVANRPCHLCCPRQRFRRPQDQKRRDPGAGER